MSREVRGTTPEKRAVIIGCGPRAAEHVDAYQHVTGARVVAACARDIDHARSFCEEYAVDTAYGDVDEMLLGEEPDLVHIATGPTQHLELMRMIDRRGTPVAIVEKPIAIDVGGRNAIRDLAASSPTRFLVNTQLPFHPRVQALLAIVANGDIGEVRSIDASAGSTILDQGVHLIDLAQRFAGGRGFERVFSNVSGGSELASSQPCPGNVVASIGMRGGVQLNLITGNAAPTVRADAPFYMQKRIEVRGTEGWATWTMWGWEIGTAGASVAGGDHDYGEEDVLGQAAFTTAAIAILHGASTHPCELSPAIEQFDVVLASYVSALEHAVVALPFAPALSNDLLGRLGQALRAG